MFEVWGSNQQLATVATLMWAQSRGDGHRSLVTPERVLSEYNEDFDVLTTIVNDCLCAVILVNSVVLRIFLLFSILKRKVPIPRKEPGRTHTYTKDHSLSPGQCS